MFFDLSLPVYLLLFFTLCVSVVFKLSTAENSQSKLTYFSLCLLIFLCFAVLVVVTVFYAR